MKPYKDLAHIHSLNGEVKEVTVLAIDTESESTAVYTVEYNGVKCKARFNPFVCMLYADDKWMIYLLLSLTQTMKLNLNR